MRDDFPESRKIKDVSLLPNFLGIGAQKAGTSWLAKNLEKHPEIYMSPHKEIHFFDQSASYPSPSQLATKRLSSRLLGREEHHKKWRHLFGRSLVRNLLVPNWKRACLDLRFYLGSYDDNWYASLFKQG